MSETTSPLPSEVVARISKRINAVGGELFKALDEVREFGHSCLMVRLMDPATGESFQVLLAPGEVKLSMEISGIPIARHPGTGTLTAQFQGGCACSRAPWTNRLRCLL